MILLSSSYRCPAACPNEKVYTLISTLFPFSTAIHGSTEPSHMRPLPRVNYSAIELPRIPAQCPKYLLSYVYIKLYIKASISFFSILIPLNPQPSQSKNVYLNQYMRAFLVRIFMYIFTYTLITNLHSRPQSVVYTLSSTSKSLLPWILCILLFIH